MQERRTENAFEGAVNTTKQEISVQYSEKMPDSLPFRVERTHHPSISVIYRKLFTNPLPFQEEEPPTLADSIGKPAESPRRVLRAAS